MARITAHHMHREWHLLELCRSLAVLQCRSQGGTWLWGRLVVLPLSHLEFISYSVVQTIRKNNKVASTVTFVYLCAFSGV